MRDGPSQKYDKNSDFGWINDSFLRSSMRIVPKHFLRRLFHPSAHARNGRLDETSRFCSRTTFLPHTAVFVIAFPSLVSCFFSSFATSLFHAAPDSAVEQQKKRSVAHFKIGLDNASDYGGEFLSSLLFIRFSTLPLERKYFRNLCTHSSGKLCIRLGEN